MTAAFKVQMTIDGNASGAKAAAAEATTAVKGLTTATRDAAAGAQTHVLAMHTAAQAAARLNTVEGAAAASILKAGGAQQAAAASLVSMTKAAQVATVGLGSSLTALSASEAAVSGATRELSVDIAKLAGLDTQARSETDALVQALIQQSHALDALRGEVAPAITAEQRFVAAQEQVTAAVRAGLITQREANVVIDQARVKYLGLPGALAGVERGAFAAGGGTRMLGQQLSQVLQQGAVTGNYLGALAIQLPDMALGFGGVAIAASMVATVALPLIIGAFGGGQSAAERATEANDAYSASFDILGSEFAAATSLHSEYVSAVLSGNSDLIKSIELEAKARQAKFNLDFIDQMRAKDAAQVALEAQKAAYGAANDEFLARIDQIAAIKKAEQDAIVAATSGEIGLGGTDFASAFESANAALTEQANILIEQQAELEKSSAEYAVIDAQVSVLNEKMDANGNLIKIVKEGVVDTASALDHASGAAAGFSSALSIAAGYAASIQASINGISFSNVGAAAELAALQGGASRGQASNAGQVAETRAQLAPIAQSSLGGNLFVNSLVDQQSGLLAEQTAKQEAIAQWVRDHPETGGATGGASGGGGSAPQVDAIQRFLEKQQIELDLLRAIDPVQKEMIRNREMLATATETQRAAVEASIRVGLEEKAQLEATAEAWDTLGNAAEQVLEDIFLNGKKASDIVADLGKQLASATLKAAILGQGPLAGLMGTAGGGGLMGGLQGLFGGGTGAGAIALAGGGFISGPGTSTSDDIPIWASDGEFMVNAEATAKNRAALEAINAGAVLPASARGFAMGGLIGRAPSGGGSSGGRMTTGGATAGIVHNHFYVTTPNPRAFAEDRVSVARGAQRLVAQAGRYS